MEKQSLRCHIKGAGVRPQSVSERNDYYSHPVDTSDMDKPLTPLIPDSPL